MRYFYIPSKLERLTGFLSRIRIPSSIILITAGIASTVWFLVRVIPKPSRASYPCIRATAPWASAFIIYLLSVSGSLLVFKKIRANFIAGKFPVAALFVVLALALSSLAITSSENKAYSAPDEPLEPANQPKGMAEGIFPGRVVWVYDPDATNEDCTNAYGDGYFLPEHTNQSVVDKMVDKALKKLTGESTVAASWDALFHYHNQKNGKGDVGYSADEIVFLKINATSTWSQNISGTFQRNNTSYYATSETSPQLILTVLRNLIEVAGIPQENIYVGDPMKSIYQDNYTMWHDVYPNVHYLDHSSDAMGREAVTASTTARIDYSDKGTVLGYSMDYLYTIFGEMDYMINLPTLKGHKHAGVTMFAKNHFGSHTRGDASHLHPGLVDPQTAIPVRNSYGMYRVQVDLMTHELLGAKNLIYLMDGLFTSDYEIDQPDKWQMAPFNNDWTSSIFISQDPVAIESVGFDFLYAEMDGTNGLADYPHLGAVDDYLHQVADSTTWPDGFTYDPEDDGIPNKFSYGVHEHWNNSTDKQYSRNLGIDDGIELVKVMPVQSKITIDNSGILSNKVYEVFVDSFNIKWFATPLGISRFNDADWDTISTDNWLLNNNTKDIAYEKTGYGHEIWVATDSGLSVLAFNVDGVTSATTYHPGIAPILGDTITAVGVDAMHNRWIGTPAGLSTFTGNVWDSIKVYMDDNRNLQDLANVDIVSIESYPKDSMIFINTHGAGTLRYTRDDVDGITAASSYEAVWGGMGTNMVNSVIIVDSVQWFGTDIGAFRHLGNQTKTYWTPYNMETGLISNNVTATEVDDQGNAWFGTDAGLSILTKAGFMSYTTADGLINPVINDITRDLEGNMWLATDGGVEMISGIPGTFAMAVPPLQAADLTLVNVGVNEMTVSWTPGDGSGQVLFMKEGNEDLAEPVNNTVYNASAVFEGGSALGDWYCVYKGNAGEVTITNLQPQSEYRIMVCEYGSALEYITYSTENYSNNVGNFTTLVDGIELDNFDLINIYPTPFSEKLHIMLPGERSGYVVKMYDMNGSVVFMQELSQQETILNTSMVNKGIYILVVTDGNRSYSYKIVK
jgi:hypothetical protein